MAKTLRTAKVYKVNECFKRAKQKEVNYKSENNKIISRRMMYKQKKKKRDTVW